MDNNAAVSEETKDVLISNQIDLLKSRITKLEQELVKIIEDAREIQTSILAQIKDLEGEFQTVGVDTIKQTAYIEGQITILRESIELMKQLGI